ncbi:MAG: S8 family serine peptidase [Pyrinomonadaceae bacterium]
MRKQICLIALICTLTSQVFAGLDIVRSSGITLTGADGIRYIGTSGITLTGADGLLASRSNGITLTGADGITLTGADGITLTGADAATYTGPNGITLTGADGITLTGADGITLTGADGITLTGADGTQRRADSVVVTEPNGITLTGADGITLTGADGITLTGADGATRVGENGITLTGADGITLTGADGITLTGADGITLTGADSVTAFDAAGVAFDDIDPAGITLTGADGITLTGADGITLTGADNVVMRNINGITLTGADAASTGLQSVDPELAMTLNNAGDDSNVNAVVAYHNAVTEADLNALRQIGIHGGTRFRVLPFVYVTGTKSQIIAVSRLSSVRSIYGNRTLTLNSDPYYKATGIERVSADADLAARNSGLPVTGRNVTVAVLDTGINSQHGDLAGRVVQNVRLTDAQSAPVGFHNPVPVENVANTDLTSGHGSFVAGVVAASGAASNGRFGGVAPGARLLGLSAGDLNLTHVLAGFDYILDRGANYGVKVVNCSFSANTVFDYHDPVNIATKMLTSRGVNVVVSAGNSGAGNGTLNPYSMAPWVIGVGATNKSGVLASFSSRGTFGGENAQPTVVAPGVNVASLRSTPTITSVGGLGGADAQRLSAGELPYYTTATGTSFSAPQVAGAIALMLEADPSLAPAEIKEILSRTATPLPKYFYHETGAGMLNTHAAVLQAAFPTRKIGAYRSTLSKNGIRFSTTVSRTFDELVTPGVTRSVDLALPSNVVQANVGISWSLGPNDFGLKLYNSGNTLLGQSNYLNLPGLTGRREEVVVRNPSGVLRASIDHTAGIGTSQTVHGALEVTRVEYPQLSDLESLPSDLVTEAERAILSNIMLPEGRRFRPNSAVSRAELAAAFVRSGLVSQYMSAAPLFTDVRDAATRNSVESVQSNPGGGLFFDAAAGSRFYPNNNASKLVAAVAYVKAAKLDQLAANSTLSPAVTDAGAIPANLRGYVAVALQRGFITLDGTQFNGSRAITRLELTVALNRLINS